MSSIFNFQGFTGTLSLEEAAITYGHILRLSVERFYKKRIIDVEQRGQFLYIDW